MNKLKEHKNYKILIGLLLGILISATGVYAATTYAAQSVFYNNGNSTLSSSDVQGAIDELADKYKKLSGCPSGYVCLQQESTLALGDYVKMTPSKSSYSLTSSKYDASVVLGSSNNINPQELNLWRVINLNDDGTVEMISEYVSSEKVFFNSATGYQVYIEVLNLLAQQYENSSYTVGSRSFGYNGQTEFISDISKIGVSGFSCSTGESCVPEESLGGGDTLFKKDYELTKNALGTISAKENGGSVSVPYWMASRHYFDGSDGTPSAYEIRYIEADSDDTDYNDDLNVTEACYMCQNGTCENKVTSGYSIRPIVVLKSGLKYSGLGTKESPMEISAS